MQIYDKNAPGFDSVIEPSLMAKIENGSSDSATLIEKTITENGEYNASADNADGYSSVTVDVAGGGGETFEVEFVADAETEEIIANKTYAQTLTAIQNNNIINFTLNLSLPIPIIYGGCFIFSNPVTEKDDMYFIITLNAQAFVDEEGVFIQNVAIIWTETGITMRRYDYNT